MADRPHIIPLFPLPNFVLFPGVRVPLHIFEPRYREMVTDVAESHGIIGMMMLKGPWEHDYHGFLTSLRMGCAGHIEELVKLPDGRFNLILEGIGGIRVEQELRERSFRQAQVRWCTSCRSGKRPERYGDDGVARRADRSSWASRPATYGIRWSISAGCAAST